MLEAEEAPNEVLVEDRMLTADSTLTLRRIEKKNGTEGNQLKNIKMSNVINIKKVAQ